MWANSATRSSDQLGQLVAHPDISKVLSGTNETQARNLRKLSDAIEEAGGRAITTYNVDGEAVVATAVGIPGPAWTVLVEQPRSEALEPIFAALRRTGVLLLAAGFVAGSLAFWLARRMAGPVRLLEQGAVKFGAGDLDHRIVVSTGDELERLAERFNDMAHELASSREREERLARLRRFLAPEVAELVEKAGDDSVLLGQRVMVAVIFCDSVASPPFAAASEPEEVMQLLAEYYRSLGAIVARFEATVTSLSADGLMVLVNAPVPCSKPAFQAVRIALAMQEERFSTCSTGGAERGTLWAAALDREATEAVLKGGLARKQGTFEAFDCWLRGQHRLYHGDWTREGEQEAIDWFRKALLVDSTFARAHSSLALTFECPTARETRLATRDREGQGS